MAAATVTAREEYRPRPTAGLAAGPASRLSIPASDPLSSAPPPSALALALALDTWAVNDTEKEATEPAPGRAVAEDGAGGRAASIT